MADSDDESWIPELETALLEGCDFGILRNICKSRVVPDHLRAEVWQISLNVNGKGDPLSGFDELYDMPNQEAVRSDCQKLVDNLGNEEDDRVSIESDLESILTFYSKSRGVPYESENGWTQILQPLLSLRLPRSKLYSIFYALVTRYIPKDSNKNPYHLFRLLLLYHDPELCSFLDSRRITPESYTKTWFRSLFAAKCDLKVIQRMWDVYFQQSDPFLMFFLALVILVNAKEQLLPMKDDTKHNIIERLSSFPAALEAEDIEDFCSLAQYYAARTPQSFRREYQGPLFGHSLVSQRDENCQISQALCLNVSVTELLSASQTGAGDCVRYFVVDCRPADQYNNGHLPTAFHLDANLMLQNPEEFSTAVQALFATQKEAIAADSIAGGEHLCFMGSGREAEDQYVHMVIANFLQKNTHNVSITKGGYTALHQALKDNLLDGLTDHDSKWCVACNPDAGGYDTELSEDFFSGDEPGDTLIGKLSNVVKNKSAIVKERVTNFIKNEQMPV